jgi:hypothetical protein
MDPPLNPPVRIQPISATPISTKSTEKKVESFIEDFRTRGTASLGGNAAATVQLKKLKDALHEERKSK